MRSVAGILLAAGESRRMGEPKQLLVHRGESLVRRAARHITACRCLRSAAVLGAYRESIEAELEGLEIECLVNPNWREGMGGSLGVGVAWASQALPTVGGVLVCLADQPGVTRSHLDALLDRFEDGADLVATGYSDRVGVPAVLAESHFEALLELRGDQGARALLRGATGTVERVAFAGAELDVDTPADYRRLLDELPDGD
ncbi:nucleotidyltransferase family protein [Myxococcota bacterium]|nr:nucleotidyltransferase family protein [Myxococcota bacterium]